MPKRAKPYPKLFKSVPVTLDEAATLGDPLALVVEEARGALRRAGYAEAVPSSFDVEPFTVPWAAARIVEADDDLHYSLNLEVSKRAAADGLGYCCALAHATQARQRQRAVTG